MKSLELFSNSQTPNADTPDGIKHFDQVVKDYGYVLEEVNIGNITFQTGQAVPVHRWFRLTPSYSPGLVSHFLKDFSVTKSNLVLDPFSGRGTTAIECQKRGIPSIGVEINPLLQQVGALSLKWEMEHIDNFQLYLDEVSKTIKSAKNKKLEDVILKYKTSLPNIHDVFRWWQPEVLKDLIIARQIARSSKYENVHNYLWLAVNGSALDCANIHRNHPTITFDDDHERDINVELEIESKIRQIVSDLKGLSSQELKNSNFCSIEFGDACDLEKTLTKDRLKKRKVDFVITSPPYPNRFSYVHQTRPQLYFMELIDGRSEATEIDLKTIGGTWGKATSDLMKSLIEPPKHMLPILDYWEALKGKSTLMCNYATKYFLDLDRHVESLKNVKSSNFRGAYVVGNSRLSGVEIYTECILAKIFERHGFTVDKIVLFRKRGGRKKLYETAVCVKG